MIHGGAVGGNHSPTMDDDGHATDRPSTFFEDDLGTLLES